MLVHPSRRPEERVLAPLQPFPITGGDWPCDSAYYGPPFDWNASSPDTPQITATPQGAVETFSQAFYPAGVIEVQGVLWKDDPAVVPDQLRQAVTKTAYAVVGKNVSLPSVGKRTRFAADVL